MSARTRLLLGATVSTLALSIATADAAIVFSQTNAGVYSYNVLDTGNYTITALGAPGGSGNNDTSAGGAGAYVQAMFNLIAGQTLNILVGGAGAGGGTYAGGGGGGGSFIWITGAGAPLVVAGGGGGGGGSAGYSGGNGATGTIAGGNGGGASNGSGGGGGSGGGSANGTSGNSSATGGGGGGGQYSTGGGAGSGGAGLSFRGDPGGDGGIGGGGGGGGGGTYNAELGEDFNYFGGGGGGGGFQGGGGGNGGSASAGYCDYYYGCPVTPGRGGYGGGSHVGAGALLNPKFATNVELTGGVFIDFVEATPTGVPEPASMGLFGLSLAGLALARRRGKK